MPPADYVVISNIIGDDLILPDGTQKTGVLGGAGTYAVAGMRVWANRVGIVSGIGKDFDKIYGDWFNRNIIDTQGLQVRAAKTPRSWITYDSSDKRTETPQFGPEHFKQMEPGISDIPAAYHNVRGLYIFRDTNEDFWQDLFDFQGTKNPTLIWEIHAGVADASYWGRVSEILSNIDLFSINLSEAQQLCQLIDPYQIIEKLLSSGVGGIALRLGSHGTIVADHTGVWRIPAYNVNVVDVTGAGNAFTGGFLVGYCENEANIMIAGQYGAIAASFMLEQFGPPDHINSSVQDTAKIRMQSLIPRQIS